MIKIDFVKLSLLRQIFAVFTRFFGGFPSRLEKPRNRKNYNTDGGRCRNRPHLRDKQQGRSLTFSEVGVAKYRKRVYGHSSRLEFIESSLTFST